MRRLKLDDRKIVEYIDRYQNLNLHFPEIRRMYYERQFQVSLLDFEPGEEIPLHDHPDMTGVVYCTTGRIVVDHYDKLQETAENGNPLLRFERHLEMTPGDTATLTATRGNIHALNAVQFTRMIDVFTPPYDRDRATIEVLRHGRDPLLGRAGVRHGRDPLPRSRRRIRSRGVQQSWLAHGPPLGSAALGPGREALTTQGG